MTDVAFGDVPEDTSEPVATPTPAGINVSGPLFVVAPTTAAPAATGPAVRPWTRRYVATLVLEDALCAVAAIALGWAVRFGSLPAHAFHAYLVFSMLLTLGWIAALQITGAYDLRAVSTGVRECQRVLRAGLNLVGAVAIIAYLTHMLVARTFIAIVIPLGVVLQVGARWVVRRSVTIRRERGEWTNAILAIGTSEAVRHLVETTRRNPTAGLRVIGACVEDADVGSELLDGVPVLGDVQHAAQIAEQIGADVVAVAGAGLGPTRIRELGWALEGTGRQMLMAPGLTEVAGPRVHVSPVEGLPLMWVDQPEFSGMAYAAKRMLDVAGSALIIVLSSPLLLAIWLFVRLTSPGPALYRSTRMGMNGRLITVYKFRSMYVDADERRGLLLEQNQFDGGVLFKMRDDPRITRAGRLLRKFSLDELPQLFNVLGGSMSLVGPRPPLPDEVEQYLSHVHRRLLVKPGITGLWQVSGRSDLSWEETVRLDLYYVENWSLGFDLAIIARTIWVVIRSRGAY